MLLNRRGAHVLFRLGGRPFTAEALVFGLLSGLAFAAAFLWFGGMGRVMDTEKILALFGAKAPALTVSFTLVLRFVPRFAEKARDAADAQRGVGFSLAGTPKDRLRGGAHLLSLLTGWALEGTVDAADSMRGRGFGLPGRTSYAARAFERRDGLLLAGIALLALALLAQGIGGVFSSNVFPVLALASPGTAGWGCAAVFYLLPAGMDLFVEGKWNWLRSKM